MSYDLKDVVKDILKGDLKISPDELKQKRYAICLTCPKFNSTTKTCTLCGCFMPAKTALLNADCPAGHW
jgi:hypothetical protein